MPKVGSKCKRLKEYQIGDSVKVVLPSGKRVGTVKKVLPNYAFSGETKYEIHGDRFVTISSGRSMFSKHVK